MTENKDIWIKTGYEIFALAGENGLKIEVLAKKVGISKSSFYHHFADLEIFVEHLLKSHLIQSEAMADKEKNAKNIDPELINILVEHKLDLLFNRQLRINQQRQHYHPCPSGRSERSDRDHSGRGGWRRERGVGVNFRNSLKGTTEMCGVSAMALPDARYSAATVAVPRY